MDVSDVFQSENTFSSFQKEYCVIKITFFNKKNYKQCDLLIDRKNSQLYNTFFFMGGMGGGRECNDHNVGMHIYFCVQFASVFLTF